MFKKIALKMGMLGLILGIGGYVLGMGTQPPPAARTFTVAVKNHTNHRVFIWGFVLSQSDSCPFSSVDVNPLSISYMKAVSDGTHNVGTGLGNLSFACSCDDCNGEQVDNGFGTQVNLTNQLSGSIDVFPSSTGFMSCVANP